MSDAMIFFRVGEGSQFSKGAAGIFSTLLRTQE
jgi:hypothetical protein